MAGMTIELSDYVIDAIAEAVVKKMQDPKKGHWVEVVDEIDSLGNKTWHHKCSICGNTDSGWGEYKYCPNCGSYNGGVKNEA